MKIKDSLKTGITFGLTSGVITTLGLLVGLSMGTDSEAAVVGGVLTICVADAFSDALGIHISEESQSNINKREIWESTISTLLSKFVFGISFIFPVIFLAEPYSVIVSIIWGFLLLGISSYLIAKQHQENPVVVIREHLIIGIVVVVLTYLIGKGIAIYFK